ncbi:hypothetical protein NKG05_09420 [Oerskovia sp. M15]
MLRRTRRVPNMEVLRGSRISVLSERPQPRQLDGDVIEPSKKLEVSVRAGALWVCVDPADTSDGVAERASTGG